MSIIYTKETPNIISLKNERVASAQNIIRILTSRINHMAMQDAEKRPRTQSDNITDRNIKRTRNRI
jgi:hypothetical protein